MPFIDSERRDTIGQIKDIDKTPGDLCYLEYKRFVDTWRESPRWTTVHYLLKGMFNLTDQRTAKILAFFVFFAFYVLPYEERKRQENGDI